MPAPFANLLGRLRRLSSMGAAESDAELLGRFVRLRDADAFAALVSRHGPMVRNACRRMLGNAHDADDAFQATFLILARRAGALGRPEALAGWLYGVASRVAHEARRDRGRRPCPGLAEAPEPPDPHPDPLAVLTARDLLRALEEEVQRLPQVYRLPVVLCCLEGLTQEETARRLGWTAGAVKGRLERGRKRLHDRLLRRGLTLAAALAVAEVAKGAGCIPAATASVVMEAASRLAAGHAAAAGLIPMRVAALTEGVLKAMFMSKLKIVAAVVVALGLAGSAAGLVSVPGPGGEQPGGPAALPPAVRVNETEQFIRFDGQAKDAPNGETESVKERIKALELTNRQLMEKVERLAKMTVEAERRLLEMKEANAELQQKVKRLERALEEREKKERDEVKAKKS
jgi:RNA polymerase sigma factor (sigma-70 family)